jgi:zinc protease
MVLAVSGDFDRETMVQKLEKLLGDWPFSGKARAAVPADTAFASPGVYLVNKDVNQGRVAMMLPGITRENPDYFPIMVMNDILGGGGFSSRIVNRVRSDEGLAYDAHTVFPGGIYYPFTFTAGYQSKSRTVAFAASIVLQEMKKIANEKVSDAELTESKRGFIDRLPRTFQTKAAIARALQQDEFTGRYSKDPEFWQKYSGRIDAVSKDDVLRVAAKYLNVPQLVILIVGQKDQILLGQPDHPVNLADLAGGRMTDVPLRDPLTMKPMGEPTVHKASAQ